jgi:ABC-type lipoprotein release transport system permease subunit
MIAREKMDAGKREPQEFPEPTSPEQALDILKHSPEIIVQRIIAGRHDLFPVRYLDTLKAIRGVEAVSTRLWGYYYDGSSGANYTLLVPPEQPVGSPMPADESRTVTVEQDPKASHEEHRPLFAIDGASLVPGTVIIGTGIARVRKTEPGEFMTFRAHDGKVMTLKIAGLLSSYSELVSTDLMLITEADFRKVFGIPKELVTDAVVSVTNPEEVTTVSGKISKQLPDSRPIVRDGLRRTYDSIFNWRGGMMIVILSSAVFAFVIFAWDKASGLSAGEKREIGILKAIGWETSDIILMKFWEGAVISLTAFLAGVILAYTHVFFTSAMLFEPALKGWSTLFPAFKPIPFISAEQLIVLFFLTVVPYTMATVVPSWRAATIDPDTAMRQTGE